MPRHDTGIAVFCISMSSGMEFLYTEYGYGNGGDKMDKRIAILGIIIEDADKVSEVNELLHEYRDYIIGRMGMPYRERNISVISIVMDAENNVISSLSGKIGNIDGVSAKAVYSKTAG